MSVLTRRDLLRAGALGAAGLAAGLGGCGEPAFAPLVPVEAWDLAFVNVNVVPMDSERVVPNQTVGIAGGRIVGIGPAAEINLPPRVRQIAGRDGYLMPGLADMHVHTSPAPSSISDVPAEARPLFSHQWMPYVASGVTTVRNMSGSLGHPEFNQFVQSEELVAPTLHTTGPFIDGFPPTWPSATVVRTPEEAVEEVQAQQQSGYAFIKVYDELLPEVYDAIVTTARDLNIPVVGHTPWHAGLEHCLAAKQSSIEHLWGYLLAAASEDLSVHKGYMPEEYVRAFDPSRVSRLAELTAAAGTWNCPTLVMWQRFYAREDVEQLLQRPEVRFVHPSMRRYWEMFVFARDRESRSRADQARKTIVKALHDAGARLLLGTDAAAAFVAPGFAIHDELRNFVAAGLTPYQAISAGTSSAADYLSDALPDVDPFGTVTQGARADLILLNSNPLSDVANVEDRAGVMLRGRWLAETELRDRLEEWASLLESVGDE